MYLKKTVPTTCDTIKIINFLIATLGLVLFVVFAIDASLNVKTSIFVISQSIILLLTKLNNNQRK